MTVELIYDADCPNIAEARACLLQAFAHLELPARWQEWSRQDPESPDHARRFGSPTVLVNGQDVAGTAPGDGAHRCRIYRTADGKLLGVPAVEDITRALTAATYSQGPQALRPSGRRALLALPASILTLIPIGTCPACWPAYGALLSSLGLTFLFNATYLLPLTVLCLAAALFGLGYRARSRRGFAPLVLGVVASLLLVASKFLVPWAPATYAAAALLLGASLWNAWPRRAMQALPCPSCANPSPVTDQRR